MLFLKKKKELFKGLWIENKWKWEEHPVIRLDFSDLMAGRTLKTIDTTLNNALREQASKYGLELRGDFPSILLSSQFDRE